MDDPLQVLGAAGLRRFHELRAEAVDAVTTRFYATHGHAYAEFGEHGRAACREDLGFHLEFLRPVLEFGLVQPMVAYLRWLASVLTARDIPSSHLGLSLEWLADFFAERMEAADADIVVAALRRAGLDLLEAGEEVPAIERLMPEPWPQSEPFEEALLAGDRSHARSLLDQCLAAGRGLVECELHVIQPALYSIGRRWQSNHVSVAQEHLATAIAQATMSHGLLQAAPTASIGRRAVLACVEGNHHSVGLHMVADALQLAGWDVQYLGASVPTGALVAHVAAGAPDLLGLSVSFAHQFRAVKEVVARLRASHGAAQPAVMIGGLAINQFDPLAGRLGASAWAPDAAAAVARASSLGRESRAG